MPSFPRTQVTGENLTNPFGDATTSVHTLTMKLHVIWWTFSASLLSSKIHKIKETWTGWSKLQYANYALRTLSKGLRFFHPVSPSESPNVMGLTGIHHPDALHHFNGVIHCSWCGKEGQNEGTVINHL